MKRYSYTATFTGEGNSREEAIEQIMENMGQDKPQPEDLEEAGDDVCQHVPDFDTLQPVKNENGLFDVWCKKCGLSGSGRMSEIDVEW